MQRFRLSAALIAFSTVAFFASTMPVLAEGIQLGSMSAQSTWSVGTVKGKRDTYCATVNSFKADKGDIVLAIARDPSGYGSLAFDFSEALFQPNSDYEASLTPGAASVRKFKGRASTDRSLIVQVGTDDAFFRAMSTGAKVHLSTPAVSGTFALGGFDATYKDLVNCADQINGKPGRVAAAAIDDAEKASMAPIDKAAADIAIKNNDRSLVFKKGETLALATTSNPLDEMEAQIDRDAAAQKEKVQQAAKEVENKKAEIAKQLEEQKKEMVQLQDQKQAMERKLLMSSSSGNVKMRETVSTLDSVKAEQGAAAKVAEKEGSDKKLAEEKTKLKNAPQVSANTIAALTAPPITRAPEKVPPAKAVEPIANKIAAAPVPEVKALPPIVTEKAEIAPAVSADAAKAAQLGKERDEVKKQLEQALTQKDQSKPVLDQQREKLNDMQNQLSQSEQSRQALENKLKEAQQQNLKNEAELKQKQKLAEAEAAKQTDKLAQEKANAEKQRYAAEMEELKRKNSDVIAAMKADLDHTSQQYEALKKDLESQKKANEAENASRAQQVAAIDRMKQDLQEKTAQAEKLQKELDAAKQDAAKKGEVETRLAAIQAEKDAAEAKLLEEKNKKSEPVAVKPDPVLEQKYSKLNDELGEKQKAMTALETQMKELEQNRAAEAERAAKANAELEEARKQLAEMKKAMTEKVANERLAADTAALQNALAMTKAEVNRREAESKVNEALAPVAVPDKAVTLAEKTIVAMKQPVVELVEDKKPSVLADENKAKTFLDRLVETHQAQKAGKPLPVMPPVDAAPVEKVEQEPVQAISQKEDVLATHEPVQAVKEIPAPEEKKSFFDRFIPAGFKGAEEKDVITGDPDLPAFPGGGITLEKLLGYSGTARVNFISVSSAPGEVLRQWTSDGLDGLYEQAASNNNVEVQSRIYLDRYRQDCRNNLELKTEPVRALSFGRLVQGTLVCKASGNKYATSFLFLDDHQAFHAVLHTGYPDNLKDLKKITGNLSATLARADRFLAPQPAMKRPLRRPLEAPAQPVTEVKAAAQPLIAPEKSFNKTDEFGTVIIE